MEPDLDDALLSAFAAGDAEAFVRFYRRHVDAVVAFLRRRVSEPEQAADLAAETFAAALVAAERYRPGERPALAWLYGIAAHKLADSRRRGRVVDRARRRLSLEPLIAEDEDLARVDSLVGVAEESQLRAALSRLPPSQRDAVLARVVDERDYVEIAASMRCSPLLVRQRVSRGLRTLRADLKELR